MKNKMMKNIFLILLTGLLIVSCKETNNIQKHPEKPQSKKFYVNDTLVRSAVIYEANIRQYSPKGDLESFTKDIPELKKLGVKIIWLMPIYPISQTKRKATGNLFVSEIKEPEKRKKYLGSPYAVADYTAVNPDFGTKKDLDKLIETAHNNEIAVILDWVPNHTGWDHKWIKEHPDYYTKNAKGEITDPLNQDGSSKGWQDVADLNYNNPELRQAMINEMKYWIENHNIDGYRCDVAGEVPLFFWKEAIPELRKLKPLFMLAEAWEPELLKDHLFDMAYGWEEHFLMVDIAKGKKNAMDFNKYIKKVDTLYEKDDILMNFVANHDENSWKGTVEESFGDATRLMTTLTYVTPGMPLIYSGQEYGLNHRLKFFEKDSIPKKKGKWFKLYKKLGYLKNSEKALYGGKTKASYQTISNSLNNKILSFKRQYKDDKIYFIGNMNPNNETFTINLQGEFIDLSNNKILKISPKDSLKLEAWNYLILKQK
jgi:glycosidase